MKKNIVLIILSFVLTLHCASHSKRYLSKNAVSSPSISKRKINNKSNRILTYSGTLTILLAKEKFSLTLKEIIEFTKLNQGYISSQTLFSINIKIPAKKFNTTMNYIKSKGEVKYENIYIQDITEVYIDTEIRLKNAIKLQNRLILLLKKTNSVTEAIKVERELSRITSQIESIKARMRLYKNQKDFSNIRVSFKTTVKPGPLGWVFYGVYTAVKWLFVWD